MKRVAIVGAGISGLAAAWQLSRTADAPQVTVFDAAMRAGGIIETIRQDGFVIELGPDSWVSEKPAARELAMELGLREELIASNDGTRKTHLLIDGRLKELPEGMRMMVPTSRAALAAMENSALLSRNAHQAFWREIERASELQRRSPADDESIASFTERHFGREVLERLAAPLLSGVFGGDVGVLSVRAVMAPFVSMERERGSVILALEEREAERRATGRPVQPIFTSLRRGVETLTESLTEQLPPSILQLNREVQSLRRLDADAHKGWTVRHRPTGGEGRDSGAQEVAYDDVILACPGHVMASLLEPIDRTMSRLLPVEASSAILVAFAWSKADLPLPPGFGFLVPAPLPGVAPESQLLAATFVDQKFPGRVPAGGRLVRAFFGGDGAKELLANCADDEQIAALALHELSRILLAGNGSRLPSPDLVFVRRWPLSLPQYAVGHLERMAALDRHIAAMPGLHVLGNALHGVGLPDLIRSSRTLARQILLGLRRRVLRPLIVTRRARSLRRTRRSGRAPRAHPDSAKDQGRLPGCSRA